MKSEKSMSLIYLKKAVKEDAHIIMHLIDMSKETLRMDNIPQWQDGNPNRSSILKDIESNIGYLLIYDGDIAGYAALMEEPDANYSTIYHGKWNKPKLPYLSIHRVAIHPQYKGLGLGRYLFSGLITLAYSKGYHQLRIDTHQKNQRMQHIIQQFSFEYAGDVFVDSSENGKRLAYQLFI